MDDKELLLRAKTFIAKLNNLGCAVELLSKYLGAKEPLELKFTKCGHTHRTSAHNLINKLKGVCPKCSDPRRKSHETFKQELHLVNPAIKLTSKYASARTKVSYMYGTCGHSHEATPSQLLGGLGLECPVCNNRSGGHRKSTQAFTEELLRVNPSITLLGEYINSKTALLYKYSACRHEYSITPSSLLKGAGNICPICNLGHRGSSKKSSAEFEEQLNLKYPFVSLVGEYTGVKNKVEVRYTSCGHTSEVIPNDLLSGHCTTCPACSPKGTSKAEKSLLEYIKSLYDGWVEENDRKILVGKELDIVLPDVGLAFEFNGTYWHSDDKKPSTYHQDKTNGVEAFGYQLIHILEWEWENQREIIKSRIAGLLGQNARIFARKLQVKEVPYAESTSFLDTNHIQGAGAPSGVRYGLYQDNELVAIMTFGTPKMMSTVDWELVRYCSKLGTNVVGGASKLLSYFVKQHTPKSIMSYAARDWSTGKLYETLGFNKIGETVPGYAYYKGKERVNRYKFQKAKLEELMPEVWDATKTERQMTEEAGWTRVYNSGNLVFVKEYK